jgi:hypothetical protein
MRAYACVKKKETVGRGIYIKKEEGDWYPKKKKKCNTFGIKGSDVVG